MPNENASELFRLMEFIINWEQLKRYDNILAKFDKHFKVRQNIIYERAKFNKQVNWITKFWAVYYCCLSFSQTLEIWKKI